MRALCAFHVVVSCISKDGAGEGAKQDTTRRGCRGGGGGGGRNGGGCRWLRPAHSPRGLGTKEGKGSGENRHAGKDTRYDGGKEREQGGFATGKKGAYRHVQPQGHNGSTAYLPSTFTIKHPDSYQGSFLCHPHHPAHSCGGNVSSMAITIRCIFAV